MDKKTIEELRELESKATPGDWIWCYNPELTNKTAFLEWCGEAWDLTLQAKGSRESEGIQYVGRRLPYHDRLWEGDEHVYVCITGNGPTSADNARFIIAMRNVFLDLLDAAERCEKAEAKLEELRIAGEKRLSEVNQQLKEAESDGRR